MSFASMNCSAWAEDPMCSPQSNTSWTVDMVPKSKTPPSLVQHPKAAAMVDNGGEVDGLWTVLATTAVPLLVFFSAYIWMYRASQRDITRGRYTQWAYMEILLLLPLLPFFPVARRIAVVNAFGLGFGIHCFYAITQYRLLRFLGDRTVGAGWSMPQLLAGDTLIHFGPWIFLQTALVLTGCPEALDFTTVLQPSTKYIWVGALTGLSHSTYCRLLIGHWTPVDLYDLRDMFAAPSHAKQLERVPFAWLGVLVGHLVASTLL